MEDTNYLLVCRCATRDDTGTARNDCHSEIFREYEKTSFSPVSIRVARYITGQEV